MSDSKLLVLSQNGYGSWSEGIRSIRSPDLQIGGARLAAKLGSKTIPDLQIGGACLTVPVAQQINPADQLCGHFLRPFRTHHGLVVGTCNASKATSWDQKLRPDCLHPNGGVSTQGF